MKGFNMMAKPGGPLCNLECTYCYYLEKEKMYPETPRFLMDDRTLEVFTREYILGQHNREITFVWHGGEPSLLGLDYFRKAITYQQKYSAGKRICNSFQTNGTLLNDEWCRFFKEHNFLIGLSIDGPEELHDTYRLNRGGKGSFAKVMNGLELLKKHGVDFNTLTVLNDVNVDHPLEVYHFLKKEGSGYIQFIPIVERVRKDCSLALPGGTAEAELAPWSVPADKFGQFMITVFNEWVKRDVGKVFVQLFDATLANEVGVPAGVCLFNEHCGEALAIEHNGDVFSCDHYVYPEYRLGNIHQTSLRTMAQLPEQQQFGRDKYESLPMQCKTCEVQKYCRGECPKNRFLTTSDNEQGLNYLCSGYKHFFRHVRPYMQFMANEIAHQRPPANVMFKYKL